jgi:hypothetical protein
VFHEAVDTASAHPLTDVWREWALLTFGISINTETEESATEESAMETVCQCNERTDIRYTCDYMLQGIERFGRCPERARTLAYSMRNNADCYELMSTRRGKFSCAFVRELAEVLDARLTLSDATATKISDHLWDMRDVQSSDESSSRDATETEESALTGMISAAALTGMTADEIMHLLETNPVGNTKCTCSFLQGTLEG